jgi:putative tryptophan/tyrosine transport system substrate-binding protein
VVIGAAGDPVKAGIVPSLAKPGGNVTGVSSLALELEGKRLELLKELVPKVSRVGVFWHPDNPYSALATKEVEGAAHAVGVRILAVGLSGPADLQTALANSSATGSKRSFSMLMAPRSRIARQSSNSPR